MRYALLITFCLISFAPNSKAQSQTPNSAVEQFAVQLISAETDAIRHQLIAQNKDLITAELATDLLQNGKQLMSKYEFPKAEQAFNLSLKVSGIINSQTGAAAAFRNLGGVSGIQGKFDQALEYFQKAADIYQTINDESGLANSLRGIGNVQSTFGNYEKAIETFARSLKLFEKTGDKAGQSTINSSLNSVYQSVGDFEHAFEYGKRALVLARETGNKIALGQSLSNLANLMNSRGDYQSALQYNKEALEIFEQQNNSERVALGLNNIGEIYFRQNDYSVAESYFRRGLELREKIGDKDGIARSNLRLGELMIVQANFQAALEFLKRSVQLRETEAKDPANLAAVLSCLGDVYFEQNDLPKAADYYKRALTIAESIGEKETTATILLASARFYLTKGERETAASKNNRAIEIAAELNLREILWKAQTLAGEIALAGNDKIRARQDFEAAIKIIEDARLLIAGGERERQQFFESKVKPYHEMIELLFNEKQFETALAYAERAKARVLLEVVQNNGHTQLNKAMTVPEQAQEAKLQKAIVIAGARLQLETANEKNDATRILESRKELERARNALNSFTTLLYVAHPELKIQRGGGEIADLNQLGALLPNGNAALIEYLVTENRTFIFLVVPGKAKPKLEVFQIDIRREDLNKRVANFRSQIAKRDLRFGDQSKNLYNLLLAPLVKQIAGKKQLIISPDAALWELPFQALINEDNKYVVETTAVSYAPSLSVLSEISRHQNFQSTASALLAFGNPVYKTTALTAEKSVGSILMNNTFADLPEAEKQVKALSAIYDAKQTRIFTGVRATETEFKKTAADFDVLHLATHGVLDDASPLYSYVLLANDGGEDGRLEAREIMQMNLKANLVVLSACETARGRVGQGEGLIGLSWSFFVAGTPTTVASLWKVESVSTTEVMINFHRQINSKSISKAEALRQSSLVLLKTERYAHPFYWAGFVLIGDGR